MRASDKRLIVGLSVSTAIAVLAMASITTPSQAQMRGGFSMGSHGGMMGDRGGMMGGGMRGPSRMMRTNKMGPGKFATDGMRGRGRPIGMTSDRVGGDGGRRPGMTADRAGGDRRGRPDRMRRGDDDRGERRDRRPDIGIAIGTGFAIGTGVAIGTAGPAGAGGPPASGALPPSNGTPSQRNAINIPPGNENRFVKDEVLLEFASALPRPAITQLLARHRLSIIELQAFTLSSTTIVRAQIENRRAVRAVLQGLGGETLLLAGQPNYLYQASQNAAPEACKVTPAVATAAAIPAGGDPAQYALAKLRIGEAHTLAKGDKILVAVIDSGIDLGHPELAGVVTGSYDALGKGEKPHQHGTAIAGAIAAHARLMGAAPAAHILAIRAFGASGASAEATTMAILKSVEYASVQQARVINMSFAGPSDPALSRELTAAKARGAVLIAASGNFGPKSPPQYPAADPNVIAVSATDADDKMFRASNIGPHIAVAAPGVDILLPSPGNDYRLISGTSFSAAYVSGVVALVLQRAPGLTPDAVRKILEQTAKDLGPAGKDPEFGAGLVDAYQAIVAVQANASAAQEVLRQTLPPQPEPAAKEAEADKLTK